MAKKITSLFIIFSSIISLRASASSSIGYEYGEAKYSPEGGSSYTFGVHKFSIFDTTGGLTAGIRGNLNKSAAQTVAESKAKEQMGEGQRFSSYNYSWNQPAPVPTDGELWTLVLGSEGNPFIDPYAPSTTDGNNLHSVLGVEYSSILWKKEMSPISLALTWGMKGYLHTAGKKSEISFSVPMELIASTYLYEKLIGYGSIAIGPYGYLGGKSKYSHFEVGINYGISENLLASISYRSTHDQYEKSKVIYTIDNVATALGIKYQF